MEQILPALCWIGFHPARAGEMRAMKDVAAEFLVTPSAGKWKLILEYGARSYEAMGEAVEAAVEAAHAAGKSGCSARVLLQAADGTWLPVWTYGLDPYPPRVREHFFGIF